MNGGQRLKRSIICLVVTPVIRLESIPEGTAVS